MQHSPFRVNRVQKNVVARGERAILTWLCDRLPQRVTPDLLTLVGVFGAVLVCGSYIASRWYPNYLWMSSFGLFLHWFGDSLDGSLARHRRIERPIYGYFLDHTVDAVCNLLIMIGLGLTGHVRMDVALFALVGYYLLCMYVFINNHLSGVFRLSFLGFGPTEIRLGLISLNVAMFYWGRTSRTIGGEAFSIYDVVVFCVGVGFTLVFLAQMVGGIRKLRDPARSGAVAKSTVLSSVQKSAHSASRKASRVTK